MSSQQLLNVLGEARSLLARPRNDFSTSSWEDSAAALREIDALVAQLKAGSPPGRVDLTVLFAPTGPIQEVAARSSWAEEFLALGQRFDAALEGDYTAKWQEFRRRRRWSFGLALGIGPLAAVWLLTDRQPLPMPVVLALTLAWVSTAVITGLRFYLWPCPRCGRPFAITSLMALGSGDSWHRLRAIVTARCVHCGLPKWAPNGVSSLPSSERR